MEYDSLKSDLKTLFHSENQPNPITEEEFKVFAEAFEYRTPTIRKMSYMHKNARVNYLCDDVREKFALVRFCLI